MANIPGQLAVLGTSIFKNFYATPTGNKFISTSYSKEALNDIQGNLNKSLGIYFQSRVNTLISYYYLIKSSNFQNATIILVVGYFPNIKSGKYQNYLSRLARFFGIDAKQDKDFLYIKKSNLPGLKPKTQNTAESIFIAINLHIIFYEANSLVSEVYIYLFAKQIIKSNEKQIIKTILVIHFYAKAVYSLRNELIDFSDSIHPNLFN